MQQHTATHCNTLQHTATHCNTLQHTTTHYITLQHTATHSSTLQHKELTTTTLHLTTPNQKTHSTEPWPLTSQKKPQILPKRTLHLSERDPDSIQKSPTFDHTQSKDPLHWALTFDGTPLKNPPFYPKEPCFLSERAPDSIPQSPTWYPIDPFQKALHGIQKTWKWVFWSFGYHVKLWSFGYHVKRVTYPKDPFQWALTSSKRARHSVQHSPTFYPKEPHFLAKRA